MKPKQFRSPQEKKWLSYRRDHVVDGGENDKSFRKKWPRKKARTNRAFRRKIAQALVCRHQPDPTVDADSQVKVVRREKIRKWGVVALGVSVKRHLEARIWNHGARKARRIARSQGAHPIST